MQRLPLQSSDLVSAGYDRAEHVLEIEFKENRIYQYSDVPVNIYEGLTQAKSPGSYFFSYINAYFRYRRIQGASSSGQAEPDDTITFITANPRKLRDMVTACSLFGLKVEQLKLPIDEIQAHDPLKIAEHKAETAYELARRPIVINDSYVTIPALGGFPGGYLKDVSEWLTADDFLALMKDKTDRRICFNDVIIYKDAKRTKVIQLAVWGAFIHEARGRGAPQEQVVVAEGQQKTIAENHNAGLLNVKTEDDVWYAFAKWYNETINVGKRRATDQSSQPQTN